MGVKRCGVLLAGLMLATPVFAADGPPLPPEPPLVLAVPALPQAEVDLAARGAWRTERRGMAVLGSWAVVNLAGGTVGWAIAEDERTRNFHAGNALWNTVNLGLAAGGLFRKAPTAPVDPREALKQADTLDRVLLFNAGIDVGYTMAGFALQQWGKNREDARLQGFGDALLVQGGFLFAFDIGLYLSHRKWTRKLLAR